ncbi:hypothetical protein BC826DRAFT_1057275 [Russula brevipes]|nr:hypothetical protein BC826DRAFT_1057275 [Russula brevipes]
MDPSNGAHGTTETPFFLPLPGSDYAVPIGLSLCPRLIQPSWMFSLPPAFPNLYPIAPLAALQITSLACYVAYYFLVHVS